MDLSAFNGLKSKKKGQLRLPFSISKTCIGCHLARLLEQPVDGVGSAMDEGGIDLPVWPS